jgi:membrane associated rhomboid family serine protease
MPYKFSYNKNYSSSPYVRHVKKKRTFPISMTLFFIILNVLIFIIQVIWDFSTQTPDYPGFFTSIFSVIPQDILQGKHLWSIFTNIFLHGGIFHLIANMASLFFVGSFLEKLIGKKRFFWLYMISGILASLFFVFLTAAFGSSELGARIFGSPDVMALGASGAIFGLAACLMLITPNAKVYVMLIPIAMPLWLGMLIMLFGLWIVSAAANLPIGNSAHFGGFICGLIYGLYLRKRYRRKVQVIDRYFSERA